MSAEREKLHNLVEEIPGSKVQAAESLLETLRHGSPEAQPGGLPLRPEDKASGRMDTDLGI